MMEMASTSETSVKLLPHYKVLQPRRQLSSFEIWLMYVCVAWYCILNVLFKGEHQSEEFKQYNWDKTTEIDIT
jgi:hypothetical protein